MSDKKLAETLAKMAFTVIALASLEALKQTLEDKIKEIENHDGNIIDCD